MNHRFGKPIFLTALAAVLCASAPASADDEMMSRFLVAPGKYILYNCQALMEATKVNLTRMHELEALMAKSGNEFANAVAYRPEYLQLSGELTDIRREATDKKCKTAPGDPQKRRVNGAIIR
jgi:hypothetical protein